MPQLLSLSSRAQEPQLWKSACPRACALQQKRPRMRSLCTTTREQPHPPQPEKKAHMQWRPAQQKLNKLINYLKIYFKTVLPSKYVCFPGFKYCMYHFIKKILAHLINFKEDIIHPYFWICSLVNTALLKYFRFVLLWIVRLNIFSY